MTSMARCIVEFHLRRAVEVCHDLHWSARSCVLVAGRDRHCRGRSYARFMHSGANIAEAVSSPPRTEIQLPAPHLTPDEVVRLQVNALRAFRDDESAIHQCYVLASPANRAFTGPLDRFTAMVQNPTYGALVSQTNALVGQPVIRGEPSHGVGDRAGSKSHAACFSLLSHQADRSALPGLLDDGRGDSRGGTDAT